MLKRANLLVFICIFFILSCNVKESSRKLATKYNSSDYKMTNVSKPDFSSNPTSAESMQKTLNGLSELSFSLVKNEMDTIKVPSNFYKIETQNNGISSELSLPVSSCSPEKDMTCKKMKRWISCEDKDFSMIRSQEQFKEATEQNCSNFKESSYVATMGMKLSKSQPNGRPCETSITNDEIKTITSCQIEKLEKVANMRLVTSDDQTSQEISSWIKIIFPPGMVVNRNPTKKEWFSGGTVRIEINEWLVKVNFTDKETPPKYEAKKDSEIVTGILGSGTAFKSDPKKEACLLSNRLWNFEKNVCSTVRKNYSYDCTMEGLETWSEETGFLIQNLKDKLGEKHLLTFCGENAPESDETFILLQFFSTDKVREEPTVTACYVNGPTGCPRGDYSCIVNWCYSQDTEMTDSGNTTEDTEMIDSGNTTEDTEMTDSGNTTEDTEMTDSGNTTEDTEMTDSGNTTEDTEMTDSGNTTEDTEMTDSGNTTEDTEMIDSGNTTEDTEMTDGGNTTEDTESMVKDCKYHENTEMMQAYPPGLLSELSNRELVKPNFTNCPTSADDMKKILNNLGELSVAPPEPSLDEESEGFPTFQVKIEKIDNLAVISASLPDDSCSTAVAGFCIKFKVSFSCKDIDLSTLQTEKDFENILHEPCSSQLISTASSSRIDFFGTSFSNDVSRQPDGSPCAKSIDQQNIELLNQCEHISLKENSKSQWVRILYPKGLISSNKPTKREWFENGIVELDINEWSIKVEYIDRNTAPTYEANKGFEKITGTLVFPVEN